MPLHRILSDAISFKFFCLLGRLNWVRPAGIYCGFLTMSFLWGGVVSPTSNPQPGGPGLYSSFHISAILTAVSIQMQSSTVSIHLQSSQEYPFSCNPQQFPYICSPHRSIHSDAILTALSIYLQSSQDYPFRCNPHSSIHSAAILNSFHLSAAPTKVSIQMPSAHQFPKIQIPVSLLPFEQSFRFPSGSSIKSLDVFP
jgi:hypothetical protein